MKSTIIGKFGKGHELATTHGQIFLSHTSRDSKTKPKDLPFQPATDLTGMIAVLRGELHKGVLHETEIVEPLPEIASEVLSRLIDEKAIDYKGLEGKVLNIIDEFTGRKPEEVIADAESPDPRPSSPRPLCAIVIGHSTRDKGAESQDGKVKEWDFNEDLYDRIAERVTAANLVKIHRSPDRRTGYQRLPADINSHQPNFTLSLHCNAADTIAGGTEMLYWHSSSGGKALASITQRHVLKALKLKNRKTKSKRSSDRGATVLRFTEAPCIITEPFFIDNNNDLKVALAKRDELAAAYAAAIDEYAAKLTTGRQTKTATKVVKSTLAGKGALAFRYKKLTKEAFFEKNTSLLVSLIGSVNERLASDYGSDANALTETDVWIILNSEMAMKGAYVNPFAKHSLGEKGLLPLPENLPFWNGKKAPNPARPMPLGRNIEQFILYLGNLKNKTTGKVGGQRIYGPLFKERGIAGDDLKEAQLLAGAVHGYFYDGNYRNRKVPMKQLLAGFRAGKPLNEFMNDTQFVHAGTSILANRQGNIDEGLSLLGDPSVSMASRALV